MSAVPSEAVEPAIAARLRERFPQAAVIVAQPRGEVTLEVGHESWFETARSLRDEFGFEQMIDLCGVDYLSYGSDEWDTTVSSEGYSRGVEGKSTPRIVWGEQPNGVELETDRRFAVVLHLLSVQHNLRVRLRTFAPDDAVPAVRSVVELWPVANWFEREAFDLYGIVFDGHQDLRRILTDYGFVGHPFRKDFPLIGNVEVRYDAERRRVVYQPVTIEPRVLVPRVIREDARYETSVGEAAQRAEGNK
ncbi:NADH-quinone oxidoreductase subunit C [Lysobacter xinjiangensis]|uniref:NADH-quinone oxidoreductase subunit C n=1 Tax=Cognatilysobacter xinjiangensis TaxID=546892 RepID=A0ABQ3BVH4_9GAMM|nr:NADH-quinone oxidoreductase subunit C [Lysobacter xinjiangensis]